MKEVMECDQCSETAVYRIIAMHRSPSRCYNHAIIPTTRLFGVILHIEIFGLLLWMHLLGAAECVVTSCVFVSTYSSSYNNNVSYFVYYKVCHPYVSFAM
jgi:hypothetical protein